MQLPADSGDFRLLDRCVVDAARPARAQTASAKGLYARVGFRNVVLPTAPPRATPAAAASRRAGSRRWPSPASPPSQCAAALVVGAGLLLALPAFAFGLFIVVEHFLTGHDARLGHAGDRVMFSGLQLLSIGILGEYIGRIFDEVKQRPLYIIVGQREGGGWGGGAATVALAAQATGTRALTA